MAEPHKPMDEALDALYRGLPRDEPPAAIDAAVLAAARQSVARPARKWGAPVALAAVLVLSVGISLRVAEEKPDAQMQPATPAPAPAAPSVARAPEAAPAAPAASDAVERQAESPAVPTRQPKSVAPRPEVARGPAREERAAQAPAEAPSAQATQAPPPMVFVPDPRADSARASPPASPSALGSASAPAPAPSAAPPSAERPAARSAMRAAPSAAQDAAPQSLAKSAAESSLAATPQSPEAWLDRISEMRAQGRHKEADESLAEFRRRHPGFVISPETLRKIEPPR